MNPPGIVNLLAEAVAIPSAADREAFLDRACGADAALRERVGRLAADHFRVGSFLEHPPAALAAAPTADFGPAAEPLAVGTTVGPYRVRELLGEGGMGAVYVAEQREPVKRRVALKVIKPGMDSREVVARFAAERQALALMDHPGIAKVLDGGSTAEGRPYFVMELVRGLPLTDYCDQAKLPTRERLELFAAVCRAVQHAHQKGVIHRDLKPSNVLVTVIDGKPVPKVIDFGVAKAVGAALTDNTVYTGFSRLVGTPLYMSPEQAELSGVDVDTRSDVYSLGVLLYELLTGTTPFDAETLRTMGLDAVRRMIREVEPPRPSQRVSTLGAEQASTVTERRGLDRRRLVWLLRGDLDRVVMKALEKERDRRYESAGALAADVGRHLAGEPVEAHPPSAAYRLRKFARRNRVALGLAGMAAALLVTLAWTAADWGGRRAATRRAVDDALAESVELQGRGKYQEARQAARRAEGLAAGGAAGRALRDQAGRRRADLELVLRLDEIRVTPAQAVKGNYFDATDTDRRLGEEFRAAGLDVDGLPPEMAADRLRATTVAADLVSTLEYWAGIRRIARGRDDPGWRHLLEVARCADPDEFRGRVRAATAAADRRALEDLAKAAGAAELPPSSVLVLAGTLAGSGSTDLAIELLRAAQRRHPSDFWINHDLASQLAHQTPPRSAEAVRYYTAAHALRPQIPGLLLNFGNALLNMGSLDEAIDTYREAIRLKPDYAAAYNNLGGSLEDKGRSDDALACYKTAIRLDPTTAINHTNLGRVYCDYKKMYDEAATHFQDALRLDPEDADAHQGLGVTQLHQGRADEAIASFERALRLKPDHVKAHTGMGAALAQKGQLDEAIARYRRAVELDPKESNAHINLGTALSAKGHHDEAVVSYKAALRLRPKDARLHNSLGAILCDRKRLYDEAIAGFREALRLDPGFADAHHNLGVALRAKGRPDEAIASYKEALRLEPAKASAYDGMGLAWQDKGDLDEAIACHRRAIELNPAAAYYQVNLGQALRAKGRPDEAIACYKEALRLDPRHPNAHNNLGAVLCDVKRDYDGAAASFRAAIRLLPNEVMFHRNLGNALKGKGDLAAAAAAYREAIRLKPDDADAHSFLGDMLSQTGHPDGALAHLRKAVAIDPNSWRLHNGLAWLLANSPDARLRDPRRAVEHARKATELSPRQAAAWNTLGLAHYRNGDWPQAVDALTKSTRLPGGDVSYNFFTLAMVHWQRGEEVEARRWYARGVAWDEKHAAADEDLGRLRSEAAEVLGVLAPPPRPKPSP